MSLKAIAIKQGLSVTTVSRALNGYDDVSAETRWLIEKGHQRMALLGEGNYGVPTD